MPRFLTTLTYQPIIGAPGRYTITTPLKYQAGSRFKERIFTVPKGFETDLATIPHWLRWLYPPDGPYAIDAVLHDYLRRSRVVEKEEADYLFWESMGVTGINPVTRYLFYKWVLILPRQP